MIQELQQDCREKTLQYLESANLLDEEKMALFHKAFEVSAQDYVDPLGALYFSMKIDRAPKELDEMFTDLSDSLARLQTPKPAMFPFGHRFPYPAKLYSQVPKLFELCKALYVPVMFSDQEEAIGLGSVNPIAVNLVYEAAIGIMREGRQSSPYLFKFSLKASSWNRLVERHFTQ